MKEYKSHKEVETKYKWDLSFLLEGKTPEQAIDEVIKLAKKEVLTKDSKYDNEKTYLKYLKEQEVLAEKMNKLRNYISNSISIDVSDPVANNLSEKLNYEFYKLSQEMGSESARFFKNSDKIAKWAKTPEYKNFKYSLENSLEEKKYQLPDVIKEFRIKESRADISAHEPFSILTNTELDYGFAEDSNGKKIKITPAAMSELRKHKDKNVRKSAILRYSKATYQHKGTLANLLFQHKKSESTFALISGHKSAIESLIFSDRVPKALPETLFKVVQDKNDLYKKFHEAHKKFYKAKFNEKMTRYDRSVELIDVELKVPVEQAIKDIKEVVKPFGKEYSDVVDEAFETNWVDFMPIKNKRSGAYSIGGTYGIDKKLICMNFDETINSVSTLAHEMGHSMHSYFSDKYNSQTNASYKIFVAEIASIFNELMYYDYLLNKTDDVKLKFKIKQEMIDGFIGTVYRQVEWANYEYDLYNAIDKGQPLGTYEAISQLYYNNQQKYSIKKEKYDPEKMIASVSVPHFYYGFYVYKYAIGQLAANIFFQKYKNEGPEALQFYIDKFLKAGGTKNPIDILKDAGIDLLDPKVYDLGFQALETNIEDFIKYGNEIFKTK